jgi:hypothetical protein
MVSGAGHGRKSGHAPVSTVFRVTATLSDFLDTNMQIFVRADRTYTLDVQVSLIPSVYVLTLQHDESVATTKQLINAKTGFPAPAQRLLYGGLQLCDSNCLAGTALTSSHISRVGIKC